MKNLKEKLKDGKFKCKLNNIEFELTHKEHFFFGAVERTL